MAGDTWPAVAFAAAPGGNALAAPEANIDKAGTTIAARSAIFNCPGETRATLKAKQKATQGARPREMAVCRANSNPLPAHQQFIITHPLSKAVELRPDPRARSVHLHSRRSYGGSAMVSNLSSPNTEASAPRLTDKRLLTGLVCLGLCAVLSMAAESGAHAQPPKACDSRTPCADLRQPAVRIPHRLPAAEQASVSRALDKIWEHEGISAVFVRAVTSGDQAEAVPILVSNGFSNAGQYRYSLQTNPSESDSAANCRVVQSADITVIGNTINFFVERQC
jgi:hypothetical protein